MFFCEYTPKNYNGNNIIIMFTVYTCNNLRLKNLIIIVAYNN